MNQIQKTLEDLGSGRTDGYGPRPIPCEIDDQVRNLLSLFAGLDASSRQAMLFEMTEKHGFVLTGFAERMAAYAVRTHSASDLSTAFCGLCIAAKLLYIKEVLLVFSLLYRSVTKLGLDPRAVFAGPPCVENAFFDEFVKAYPDRSEEDGSIEAMGYIESSDDDGFRYQRTW